MILVFSYGCTPIPQITPTSMPLRTDTFEPSKTITTTRTLLPNTQTSTNQKWIPTRITPATPIPSNTFSPSLTPLSTLSPIEAEIAIRELMETNGYCEKLCFWGIYPLETRYDQAVQFLKTLSPYGGEWISKSSTREFFLSLDFMENLVNLSIKVVYGVEKVRRIEVTADGLSNSKVTGEDWAYYRPDEIMKTYGVPSRVMIDMGEGQEGVITYGFYLYYDQQGLYLEYRGNQGTRKPGTVIHACPLQNNAIAYFYFGVGVYEDTSE